MLSGSWTWIGSSYFGAKAYPALAATAIAVAAGGLVNADAATRKEAHHHNN
jgi:hypothetical protein